MAQMQYDGDNGKKMKKWSWLFRGILVSLAAAFVFTLFYDSFREQVEQIREKPLETEENLGWLYQNTYLLYRDLYNRENQTHADYLDLYVQLEDERWITDENARDWYETYGALEGYFSGEELEAYSIPSQNLYETLQSEVSVLSRIFRLLETEYGILNNCYSYVIRDDRTGYYVTNLSQEELDNLEENSYFLLSFTFDSAGSVTVGEGIRGADATALRRTALQATKQTMQLNKWFSCVGGGPVDCTVTYAVSKEVWADKDAALYNIAYTGYSFGDYVDLLYYHAEASLHNDRWTYQMVGVFGTLTVFMLIVFVLGIFLPLGAYRPWKERRLCMLPLEVLLGIAILLFGLGTESVDLVATTASGRMHAQLAAYFGQNPDDVSVILLSQAINLLVFGSFFFGAWYLGICTRVVKEIGLKGYLRERCLICRIPRSTIERLKRSYQELVHVDLTKNSLRTIRKLVLLNALILSVISLTWLGGLGIVVVYSVVLYFILRRYMGDVQRRYRILLRAVDEMAEGNLNVSIEEDLGVFEPFKPQILKIQNGFKKAVDEEVKSQRMKAELITNVSHDLKTPLTAIITYVNLLKDPNLSQEKRQEYLDIMERKSLRLKGLIEDLFEVSKANSRNVTLNLMPVDIMNLVKQVSFEMQDKLKEAELDVRMNLTDEKVSLSLDSQKTYRVYENLFSNVAKYALKGTRVYVNGFRLDDTVVITIKNISAQELTVDAAELTERFVRGDASRNTEGSGLGLAIAKSFMELQGGELKLEVDGDLFKVTTVWKVG